MRPGVPGRSVAVVCALLLSVFDAPAGATRVTEPNERLLREIVSVHRLSPVQSERLRAVFGRSGFMGQGNPAVSRHPVTPEQCRANLAGRSLPIGEPGFERICGARHMAPLYDPARERANDARACIDQFEFPDLPCEYPVVWTRASEAAEACAAMGKRLCDAHEWEGACAGALEPPDYRFDLVRPGASPGAVIEALRTLHNRREENRKSWSYGPVYRGGICATGSGKTPGCVGGGWDRCGSNTYPAASFPDCRSPLGVFDLHGNAAEHMNLPLAPDQMSSRGSRVLGYTEMKGSWFIFDTYRAHEDSCRWRAPYWHGTRVLDPASHANYHLGFRCCKTLHR